MMFNVIVITDQRDLYMCDKQLPITEVVIKDGLKLTEVSQIIQSSVWYRKNTLFLIFGGIYTILEYVCSPSCNLNKCVDPAQVLQLKKSALNMCEIGQSIADNFISHNEIDMLYFMPLLPMSLQKFKDFHWKIQKCQHKLEIEKLTDCSDEIQLYNIWCDQYNQRYNSFLYEKLPCQPIPLPLDTTIDGVSFIRRTLKFRRSYIKKIREALVSSNKFANSRQLFEGTSIKEQILRNELRHEKLKIFFGESQECVQISGMPMTVLIINEHYKLLVEKYKSNQCHVLTCSSMKKDCVTDLMKKNAQFFKDSAFVLIALGITDFCLTTKDDFCGEYLSWNPENFTKSKENLLFQSYAIFLENEIIEKNNCNVLFLPLIPPCILASNESLEVNAKRYPGIVQLDPIQNTGGIKMFPALSGHWLGLFDISLRKYGINSNISFQYWLSISKSSVDYLKNKEKQNILCITWAQLFTKRFVDELRNYIECNNLNKCQHSYSNLVPYRHTYGSVIFVGNFHLMTFVNNASSNIHCLQWDLMDFSDSSYRALCSKLSLYPSRSLVICLYDIRALGCLDSTSGHRSYSLRYASFVCPHYVAFRAANSISHYITNIQTILEPNFSVILGPLFPGICSFNMKINQSRIYRLLDNPIWEQSLFRFQKIWKFLVENLSLQQTKENMFARNFFGKDHPISFEFKKDLQKERIRWSDNLKSVAQSYLCRAPKPEENNLTNSKITGFTQLISTAKKFLEKNSIISKDLKIPESTANSIVTKKTVKRSVAEEKKNSLGEVISVPLKAKTTNKKNRKYVDFVTVASDIKTTPLTSEQPKIAMIEHSTEHNSSSRCGKAQISYSSDLQGLNQHANTKGVGATETSKMEQLCNSNPNPRAKSLDFAVSPKLTATSPVNQSKLTIEKSSHNYSSGRCFKTEIPDINHDRTTVSVCAEKCPSKTSKDEQFASSNSKSCKKTSDFTGTLLRYRSVDSDFNLAAIKRGIVEQNEDISVLIKSDLESFLTLLGDLRSTLQCAKKMQSRKSNTHVINPMFEMKSGEDVTMKTLQILETLVHQSGDTSLVVKLFLNILLLLNFLFTSDNSSSIESFDIMLTSLCSPSILPNPVNVQKFLCERKQLRAFLHSVIYKPTDSLSKCIYFIDFFKSLLAEKVDKRIEHVGYRLCDVQEKVKCVRSIQNIEWCSLLESFLESAKLNNFSHVALKSVQTNFCDISVSIKRNEVSCIPLPFGESFCSGTLFELYMHPLQTLLSAQLVCTNAYICGEHTEILLYNSNTYMLQNVNSQLQNLVLQYLQCCNHVHSLRTPYAVQDHDVVQSSVRPHLSHNIKENHIVYVLDKPEYFPVQMMNELAVVVGCNCLPLRTQTGYEFCFEHRNIGLWFASYFGMEYFCGRMIVTSMDSDFGNVNIDTPNIIGLKITDLLIKYEQRLIFAVKKCTDQVYDLRYLKMERSDKETFKSQQFSPYHTSSNIRCDKPVNVMSNNTPFIPRIQGDNLYEDHSNISNVGEVDPDTYKVQLCQNTTKLGVYCDKEICHYFHKGCPDSFYKQGWENLCVTGVNSCLEYIVGAAKSSFKFNTVVPNIIVYVAHNASRTLFVAKSVSEILPQYDVECLEGKNPNLENLGKELLILIGKPHNVLHYLHQRAIRITPVLLIDEFEELVKHSYEIQSVVEVIRDFTTRYCNKVVFSDKWSNYNLSLASKYFSSTFCVVERKDILNSFLEKSNSHNPIDGLKSELRNAQPNATNAIVVSRVLSKRTFLGDTHKVDTGKRMLDIEDASDNLKKRKTRHIITEEPIYSPTIKFFCKSQSPDIRAVVGNETNDSSKTLVNHTVLGLRKSLSVNSQDTDKNLSNVVTDSQPTNMLLDCNFSRPLLNLDKGKQVQSSQSNLEGNTIIHNVIDKTASKLLNTVPHPSEVLSLNSIQSVVYGKLYAVKRVKIGKFERGLDSLLMHLSARPMTSVEVKGLLSDEDYSLLLLFIKDVLSCCYQVSNNKTFLQIIKDLHGLDRYLNF